MPPLRIALVCDWFAPRLGGIERHLSALADRLARAGHEVTVITPMPDPTSASTAIRIRQVPASMLPVARVMWTPPAFRRLGQILLRERFDVVHVHTSLLSPAAFTALSHAQRLGLPAVSTTHSLLGRWRGAFSVLDRLFHWSRWPVVFTGVSQRVAHDLDAFLGVGRSLVLPNAIEPSEWAVPPRPPADFVAIACVMRLVPRKRGAALLRALGAAASGLASTRRVTLRIAGVGPELRRLRAIARGLPRNVTVEFLGALPPAGVRQLLGTSHFFALPSKLEAFGIAALEARAAGLPVLAMAEGGVREFITPGVDGLLAADDPELAAHLGRLCTDDALRERIAAHNRQTSVACTWDAVLPAHLHAYSAARRLATAHPAPRDAADTPTIAQASP